MGGAESTSPGWFRGRKAEVKAPQKVRTLTAAATRLDLDNRKEARRQRALRQGWQLEAWAYRDSIGELRYAINFLANCTARMRIFPAGYSGDETDTPIPLSEVPGVPDAVVAACNQAMRDLGNGKMAISGLLHSASTNLSVAGEGFLLGQEDPMTSVQKWSVRSIDEIIVYDDAYKLREVPMDPQGILGWTDLDPNFTVASRMWQPHPRFRILADSPLRAIMDDCESLLILRRMIRAAGRSRLAGRGILLMPEELDITVPNDDDDDPAGNSFMEELTNMMVTPISDEGVASSVVPMMVRGPAEYLDKARLLDMSMAFDEISIKNREELVGIIATGLDIPKEVITGMADLNHWTAWQVDDNTFRHHVEPHVISVVDCLTAAFLRPYILNCGDVGTLDPSVAAFWAENALLWYDPTELVTHPDQTADALELHDRLSISDETLRRVAGFTESDKPGAPELLSRLISKMHAWPPNLVVEVLHQIDPTLEFPPITVAGTVPGIKAGANGGVDLGPPPPAAPGAPTPPEAPPGPSTPPPPVPSTSPAPSLPGPPDDAGATPPANVTASAKPNGGTRLSLKLLSIDQQLRARLHTAANAAMMRQLEKAGGRLRSKVAKDESLRSKIAMTRNEHVAAVLGQSEVENTGLTAAGLMETDWGTLKDQFLAWTAAAQQQAVTAVRQALGLDAEDDSVTAAMAAMEASRNASWSALSDAMDALATKILYQPHPGVDVETVLEGVNPETVVPTGLIRAACAVAGGGDVGLIPTSVGEQGIIPLGVSVGQVGTGATIGDLLSTNGATQRAYTWEHGPSLRAFEPHEALDGVEFESFDDEALANDDGFPGNQFFFPGDHTGCLCDYRPDWLLPDDSGSDEQDDDAAAEDAVAE